MTQILITLPTTVFSLQQLYCIYKSCCRQQTRWFWTNLNACHESLEWRQQPPPNFAKTFVSYLRKWYLNPKALMEWKIIMNITTDILNFNAIFLCISGMCIHRMPYYDPINIVAGGCGWFLNSGCIALCMMLYA